MSQKFNICDRVSIIPLSGIGGIIYRIDWIRGQQAIKYYVRYERVSTVWDEYYPVGINLKSVHYYETQNPDSLSLEANSVNIYTKLDSLQNKPKVCECGMEKHGFANHSNWCPKAVT